MKRKHAIILAAIGLLVLLPLAVLAVLIPQLESKLEGLNDMEIRNIDLSLLQDGTYSGAYRMLPVSAEVEVEVQDGTITRVRLVRHVNGQGVLAESIPGEIVRRQSLEVDVVAGATYSSKVILKAVELALAGDPK